MEPATGAAGHHPVVEPVAAAEVVVPAQVSSEDQLLRFAPPSSLLLAVSFFWPLPLALLLVVEPPAVRLAELAAVRVVARLLELRLLCYAPIPLVFVLLP